MPSDKDNLVAVPLSSGGIINLGDGTIYYNTPRPWWKDGQNTMSAEDYIEHSNDQTTTKH